MKRCTWVNDNPKMVAYHDTEWGVPVLDDRKMFEFLVLESFQAGLSWECVLNKRESFRKAFAGFDPKRVSRFTEKDVQRLLQDASIIRNQAKIRAAIGNASRFLEVQSSYGSFCKYLWAFQDTKRIDNRHASDDLLPAKTALAEVISKDLKAKGFKFLGPTVIYAHMQAVGMVNDHLVDCPRHGEIASMPKEVRI